MLVIDGKLITPKAMAALEIETQPSQPIRRKNTKVYGDNLKLHTTPESLTMIKEDTISDMHQHNEPYNKGKK